MTPIVRTLARMRIPVLVIVDRSDTCRAYCVYMRARARACVNSSHIKNNA